MNTFPLRICIPEADDLTMDVTHVIARTHVGLMGILAKHEPLLAACPQGTIRIQQDGVWTDYQSDPFIISTDGTNVMILSSCIARVGTTTPPQLLTPTS